MNLGSMYFGGKGASTVTTTLTTGTPVLINGTFVNSPKASRFSVVSHPETDVVINPGGTALAMQYDGKEDITGFITVMFDAEKNGSGTPDLEFGIYVDDILQAVPRFLEITTTAIQGSLRVPVELLGDSAAIIDVRCDRVSGSADIDIRNITLDFE